MFSIYQPVFLVHALLQAFSWLLPSLSMTNIRLFLNSFILNEFGCGFDSVSQFSFRIHRRWWNFLSHYAPNKEAKRRMARRPGRPWYGFSTSYSFWVVFCSIIDFTRHHLNFGRFLGTTALLTIHNFRFLGNRVV